MKIGPIVFGGIKMGYLIEETMELIAYDAESNRGSFRVESKKRSNRSGHSEMYVINKSKVTLRKVNASRLFKKEKPCSMSHTSNHVPIKKENQTYSRSDAGGREDIKQIMVYGAEKRIGDDTSSMLNMHISERENKLKKELVI